MKKSLIESKAHKLFKGLLIADKSAPEQQNSFKMDKFRRFKAWLSSLSYRTGLYVVAVCVLCYVISFAQMLLPISVSAKGALWVVFFGLAKAAQYSAILILGKAGIETLRKKFKARFG